MVYGIIFQERIVVESQKRKAGHFFWPTYYWLAIAIFPIEQQSGYALSIFSAKSYGYSNVLLSPENGNVYLKVELNLFLSMNKSQKRVCLINLVVTSFLKSYSVA